MCRARAFLDRCVTSCLAPTAARGSATRRPRTATRSCSMPSPRRACGSAIPSLPRGRVVRTHEAIAFVLHQCAAQRRPAVDAPLSPPPHRLGTNSLDVIACRCCGRRVVAGIGPDGFGVLVDVRPVARLVTGRVGYRVVAGRRTPRFAEVTSGTTGHVYREHWQRCRLSRAARVGWPITEEGAQETRR